MKENAREILGLRSGETDREAIERGYAEKLSEHPWEENPEAHRRIVDAYESLVVALPAEKELSFEEWVATSGAPAAAPEAEIDLFSTEPPAPSAGGVDEWIAETEVASPLDSPAPERPRPERVPEPSPPAEAPTRPPAATEEPAPPEPRPEPPPVPVAPAPEPPPTGFELEPEESTEPALRRLEEAARQSAGLDRDRSMILAAKQAARMIRQDTGRRRRWSAAVAKHLGGRWDLLARVVRQKDILQDLVSGPGLVATRVIDHAAREGQLKLLESLAREVDRHRRLLPPEAAFTVLALSEAIALIQPDRARRLRDAAFERMRTGDRDAKRFQDVARLLGAAQELRGWSPWARRTLARIVVTRRWDGDTKARGFAEARRRVRQLSTTGAIRTWLAKSAPDFVAAAAGAPSGIPARPRIRSRKRGKGKSAAAWLWILVVLFLLKKCACDSGVRISRSLDRVPDENLQRILDDAMRQDD